MKRLSFFIFCFPFLLLAQDGAIDSLKFALKNAKHDTTRCNILNILAETASDEEWPVFNQQLLKLAEKGASTATLNTPSKRFYLKHLAGALNNIGVLATNQDDITKALKYFHKSLKILEEIKDKESITTSLNNIGHIYNNQGDISMALEYFHKSLKIQEEILKRSGNPEEIRELKKGLAFSLNNIGVIYNDHGDIAKALDYYHKSLKIDEEIKDNEGIATSLHNIGSIYDTQGDISKALEYNHRSLKIKEEINDKKGIALSLNNIGVIYQKEGDTPKTLEYFLKSLKISEEIMDKNGIAYSLNNIGSIYKNQGDLSKALEYYLRSLKIQEEIEDNEGIAYSLNNIGMSLLKQGKVVEANVYAIRSIRTAKELGYPENIRYAASLLKQIYIKQNKHKEAYFMYELEIQMRDSINNTETKKASIKKQFQYQYEKKAAADSVKNDEEQKVKNAQLTAQHAQLKQEKIQRFALYGGLVLVVAFLGFVYNRFRVTQKQKVIIEDQKILVDDAFKHLEEKNKEVMDSIHYAKRIQTALLPNEKYIERKLNELN